MINAIEEIKHRKIIFLLIFTLIFIVLITYIFTSLNKKNQGNQNIVDPTTNFTPKTTLPPERLVEFEYPLKYKSISIDYRPKSGTFIVYYQGSLELAEDMYREFLTKKGLLTRNFNVDFRSTDPISPMPREFTE